MTKFHRNIKGTYRVLELKEGECLSKGHIFSHMKHYFPLRLEKKGDSTYQGKNIAKKLIHG